MDPTLSGENEASQDSQNAQDPSVEVENRADDSSEIKSKDANGEETNIEIETGEKPKSSTGSSSSSSDNSDEDSNEKKEVVLEPEAEQSNRQLIKLKGWRFPLLLIQLMKPRTKRHKNQFQQLNQCLKQYLLN